jgi:hypothetical protein
VTAFFETILHRPPTEMEVDVCTRFLRDQENRMLADSERSSTPTQQARASLAHVLLNSAWIHIAQRRSAENASKSSAVT